MEPFSADLTPQVFHNYRHACLSFSKIGTGCLCYEYASQQAVSASPNFAFYTAFARSEILCLQHLSLHSPQPVRRAPAICAAVAMEARIVTALGRVAQLVVEDPTFIPVFERLERELAEIQSQSDAIERAHSLLHAPHQNAIL